MTHPTGSLPNEAYAEGLRQADTAVVREIYQVFRQPLLHAIAVMDGPRAESGALFQAAVVEVARRAHADELPKEQPFFAVLENLVAEHLRFPRNKQAPAEAEDPQPAGESMLDATLETINSWKTMPPDPEAPVPPGFEVWQQTEALERSLAVPDTPKPAQSKEPTANRIWRYALLALSAGVLGYAVMTWFNRPKALFDDNFNPPESFMADRALRYGAMPDTGQTAECERLLTESDQLYQSGRLEEAQEPLLLIVLDSTSTACQADGWYFLGLLRLRLGDPETALECLSKIEDLEHYGDDIQWHMALAFVQLAEKSPALRDKARRALEKIATSQQPESRRAQASAMLEQFPE